MQRKTIIALLTLIFFLSPLPVTAGFEYEEITEHYYLVSYELSKWTRGGVLDTQERMEKRLAKNTHKLCLKEDYGYLRFPQLQEIARDEALRAAWLAKSNELADESGWDKWVQETLETEMHSARKIVVFSTVPGDGLETCKK